MELKKRWKSKAYRASAERIIDAVAEGGKISSDISPFEAVDGRMDLRCFSFGKGISFQGCVVKDTDLSGSNFADAWIEACLFENVRFNGAQLKNIKDHDNEFTGCSFSRASFFGAGIGFKGSKYNHCVFENANFKQAVFIRAEMNHCAFIDCMLKGVDFNATSFEDCRFSGRLEDVWFRGGFPVKSDIKDFGKPRKNRMRHVSFEDASLWGITFSDKLDLSTVLVPKDGKHILCYEWKKRLTKLKKELSDWPLDEKREASIFIRSHLVHAQNQDWYILNIDDVKSDYGEQLALKLTGRLSI
jgi:uncharacterized protein YjbI with pentapeptide repeats